MRERWRPSQAISSTPSTGSAPFGRPDSDPAGAAWWAGPSSRRSWWAAPSSTATTSMRVSRGPRSPARPATLRASRRPDTRATIRSTCPTSSRVSSSPAGAETITRPLSRCRSSSAPSAPSSDSPASTAATGRGLAARAWATMAGTSGSTPAPTISPTDSPRRRRCDSRRSACRTRRLRMRLRLASRTGWRCTAVANASRSSSSTVVGTLATTVADRGSPVTSEISPKTSPRRSRATACRPSESRSPRKHSASPSTIRNRLSPESPARQIVLRGLKLRRRISAPTSSSSGSVRDPKSGVRPSGPAGPGAVGRMNITGGRTSARSRRRRPAARTAVRCRPRSPPGWSARARSRGPSRRSSGPRAC